MVVEVLVSASLVLAVDQLSKKIVLWRLAEGQFSSVLPLVRIRRITNTREMLGLTRNRLVWLLLWGLTGSSTILLFWYGPSFQSQVAQIGLGAALGGATSNVLDRLWRRGVIDFIDVVFWPVFNLADVAIVLGVTIALWFIS